MDKLFEHAPDWLLPALIGLLIGGVLAIVSTFSFLRTRSYVLVANIMASWTPTPVLSTAVATPKSVTTPIPSKYLQTVLDAEDAIHAGEIVKAREILLPLLKKVTDSPTLGKINEDLGDIYIVFGDYKSSNGYYEQAYNYLSTPGILYKLAGSYKNNGDYKKALEKLDYIIHWPGSEADPYREDAQKQVDLIHEVLYTITPTPGLKGTDIAGLSPTQITTPVEMTNEAPTLEKTMSVNEYGNFTVYWERSLWEEAISGTVSVEDFEKDASDYGELSNPFLTGNGLLLKGSDSFSGQILTDDTLLDTGNVLHFRDFSSGLTVTFPDKKQVSAFGFDYRPSEDWKLLVENYNIPIQGGRKGFVGVVFHNKTVDHFILASQQKAQGGLTVDNISFVIANP
jgi:tetratricopeptide (TPR) repeat protein